LGKCPRASKVSGCLKMYFYFFSLRHSLPYWP
jgi:hypothetical protein